MALATDARHHVTLDRHPILRHVPLFVKVVDENAEIQNPNVMNALLEAMCWMISDVETWPESFHECLCRRFVNHCGLIRTLDDCIRAFMQHFPVTGWYDDTSRRRFGQLFLLVVARCRLSDLDAISERLSDLINVTERPVTMTELESFCGTRGRPKTLREFDEMYNTI